MDIKKDGMVFCKDCKYCNAEMTPGKVCYEVSVCMKKVELGVHYELHPVTGKIDWLLITHDIHNGICFPYCKKLNVDLNCKNFEPKEKE